MDDLRWTLLLVGAIAVVAIYFSGRFESEDWKRERNQFSKKKATGKIKKSRRKESPSEQTRTPVPSGNVVKKEPRMDVAEVDPAPAPELPAKQEKKVEPSFTKTGTVVIDPAALRVSVVESVDAVPEVTASKKASVENTDETVTTERSSIEDEITKIEIPVDLEVVEAEIQVSEAELENESAPVEESADIEPLVLSVTVLADEDEKFDGLEIKEALHAEGLAHGAMQIFHFHDSNTGSDTDDAVFSVANMLEPGIFDMGNLDGMQTPGLMLFCQLPGPLEGEAALELMLDKGRGLAVRLHGQMCDDKRNLFTTQAKNHYLDRIAAFARELALARSKMSTTN